MASMPLYQMVRLCQDHPCNHVSLLSRLLQAEVWLKQHCWTWFQTVLGDARMPVCC